MLTAELPNWIIDAGSLAAAITAVLVVLGLLTRAKPVRWVWRQLIGEPVGRWAGGIVSAQVDPVRADVAELRNEVAASNERLLTHVQAEDVAHRRIDSALQRLAEGNPEVRP